MPVRNHTGQESCLSGIILVKNHACPESFRQGYHSDNDLILTRCDWGMKTGGLNKNHSQDMISPRCQPFQRANRSKVPTVPKYGGLNIHGNHLWCHRGIFTHGMFHTLGVMPERAVVYFGGIVGTIPWGFFIYGNDGMVDVVERLVLWNDWYYGTTGIMERLVLWNDWYYGTTGIMERLVLWNDWYYGTTGIMERLVLWNDWYYGTTGIMERLVLWNDWYYGTTGIMERLVLWNDWYYGTTGIME